MTRVLQVVADGRPGGGTTHVLDLLKGLGGGYDLGLVTQSGSYLSRAASEIGIHVIELDFFRSRLDWRLSGALIKAFRAFAPDVIHAHGGRAGFWVANSRPEIPFIYTVHGYHFTGKRGIARVAGMLAEKRIASRARVVILVSNHDLEIGRRYGILKSGQDLRVVYNGVHRSNQRPRSGESRGIDISFIGRLEEQKDPLLFAKVMGLLPQRRAMLVGDGPKMGELCRYLADENIANVAVVGAKSHSDVMDILVDTRVVVMTSRWEGLPILCLEAMSVGTPVVAAAVGGLREIIASGRTGGLVLSRRPEDFAEAVETLLGDAGRWQEMASNAAEDISARFSIDGMLASLRTIYADAVEATTSA